MDAPAPVVPDTAQQTVADAVGAVRSTGAAGLSRVLHEVPAAVLMVDVASRTVVHANRVAEALTSGAQRLPTPAARWSALAGLCDLAGEPFDDGASPLDRAAAGQAVFGEPVQLRDGRTLWVTGFPLPGPDRATSLVAFFELDTAALGPDVRVRDRAVVAAGLAFTISDPGRPDNPLVFVNPAFERTTGWSAEEVYGRNCRFLQGPDTDPAAVDLIREAVATEQHLVLTLLNYRKDGTAFWNELSLSPVYDGNGLLTHYVGIQADVTARVLVEQERERHLLAEQTARADAEQAQARLTLLAEATSMLAATLDVGESLDRLAALVVPSLADWCMVELVGTEGEMRRVASAHVDPEKDALLRDLAPLQPASRTSASPVSQVVASGQPLLLRTVPDSVLDELDEGTALTDAYRQLAPHSAMVVPLKARRQVLGALSIVSSSSGRTYDEDDLSMAADLARRAALTVDNARLYQQEHQVAEQLQRSLLPQLPTVPGLDVAARYLPGVREARVGGDWYDVFPLPDGAVGIAVGDVMGHDLTAAASMGQLRSVLRSYAWQGARPATVLDNVDELVQGMAMAQLATVAYARLERPVDGAPGELCFANAGHLPPALRGPDGVVRLLDGGRSLLIGVATGTERTDALEELASGSMLVLYTDGLVEQRGLDPDEGLERLRRAVAEVEVRDAEQVCDDLVGALDGADREDDVALLVVRVL
jgi:PAS domain S-box-containing protein